VADCVDCADDSAVVGSLRWSEELDLVLVAVASGATYETFRGSKAIVKEAFAWDRVPQRSARGWLNFVQK
jgi:hypothetical protein